MNSVIRLLSCAVAVGAILNPIMSLAENPQISIKISNCLTDGSGTPGICAVSNIKRIALEVTFHTKGNNNLKRLAETAINPIGTMPANYLVIRAVDNQSGASMPVEAAIAGAEGLEAKQIVNANVEIMEDSSAREGKLQTFVDQAKAQDLSSGAASQAVVDEATQKNADILAAIEEVYVENRLGRFKLSAEYHSTQEGAWNGTATSIEVTVDVVNKGSGITALQNP